MKIKLKQAVKMRDEMVTELNLDLEKICGRDIIKAEQMARMLGDDTGNVQYSKVFQAALASSIMGIAYDDMMELKGPDFIKITDGVVGFLNGLGSEEMVDLAKQLKELALS